MQKRVYLAEIEIPESRDVVAHFLMVIEDGEMPPIKSRPHTVTFKPDANPDMIFQTINDNITTREDMRWPPIPSDEWARAVAVCQAVHTPEVKAAYELWKQEQMAKIAMK